MPIKEEQSSNVWPQIKAALQRALDEIEKSDELKMEYRILRRELYNSIEYYDKRRHCQKSGPKKAVSVPRLRDGVLKRSEELKIYGQDIRRG